MYVCLHSCAHLSNVSGRDRIFRVQPPYLEEERRGEEVQGWEAVTR